METQTEATTTIEAPKVEKSIHPSKTKPNHFYWKVAVTFADSKTVEKFSPLFEGEEACQADMELNSDAKVQQVIEKKNKAA